MQFHVDIRSSAECLLYAESFLVDMSAGTGHFALILGQGQRTDAGAGNLHQVFHPSLQIAKINQCPDGFAKKTSDKLFLVVSFDDGRGSQALAPIEITAAPLAIEAINVAGVPTQNVVRVKDGPAKEFTKEEFSELQALISGSSALYTQKNTALIAPALSGGEEADDSLVLDSTTHAAKGYVLINPTGGNVGIGTVRPEARLHLAAGTNENAPLLITPGTLLSEPTPGAIEFDGISFFYTTIDGTRETIGAAGAGITALSGDVLASGNGSATATVKSVGGSTAANINTAVIAVNDQATNLSTVSTLVKRDVGGSASLKALKLDGATSGTLTQTVPASSSTYTLTWPSNVPGTTNSVLTSDTSGNLSWVNLGSIAGSVNLGTQTTGTLPITKGGTNASTPLVNNRIMASSGGAIVEAAAITANRALVSDANGIPTQSAVTATELGHLSGVTSPLQTQLDGKSSLSGWSNLSVMGVNSSGTLTAYPGATTGTIMQHSLTGPAWSAATYPASTTVNRLLYSSANNIVNELPTANNAVLTTNGSGVPSWSVLSNDTFAQYALLAGRAGGQTLLGGTAASNNLTLESTSHASKGRLLLAPNGGNVGIGTSDASNTLQIGDTGHASYALATISETYGAVIQTGKTTSPTVGAALWVRNKNNGGTANEILYVQNNGNIGVGTSTPDSLLSIEGSGGTSETEKIVLKLSAGGNGGIATAGSGPTVGIRLGHYFDSRAMITPSEAGANSPSDSGTANGKDLYVSGGRSDNANGKTGGRLFLSGGSGHNGGAFGTNYGNVVLAKDGGSVGVGTTSTTAKFEVLGNPGSYGDFHSYTGVTANSIWPKNQTPESIVVRANSGTAPNPANATYRGGIGFGRGVGIYSVNPNPNGSPFYGDIRFHTTVWNPSTLQYDNYDRMTITLGGNVGIGTTSPISPLAVVGTADTSTFPSAPYNFSLTSSNVAAQGVGGGMLLGGAYTGTTTTTFAVVSGVKENNTAGDFGGALIFSTRPNGGAASERMRISSTGNVGIGTNDPSSNLEIASTSPILTMNKTGTSAGWNYLRFTTGIYNSIDNLTSSQWELGLMQAGTTSAASDRFSISRAGGSVATTGIHLLRDGNVGIGTVSPSYKLHVAGDINTTSCFRIGASVVGGTCTSDARLKENVQDYSEGLSDLLNIRLRTYQFNGLGEMPKTGETAVGVIAQEVEQTNPELVKTRMVKMHPEDTEQTEIKVVDYSKFTYMLINAVKELYHKLVRITERQNNQDRRIANVDATKADKDELNKKIAELKATNEKLLADSSQLKTRADKAEKETLAIKQENATLKSENVEIKRRLEQLERKINSLR